jgi:hypothetical protein
MHSVLRIPGPRSGPRAGLISGNRLLPVWARAGVGGPGVLSGADPEADERRPTVVKMGVLERRGIVVPYRMLHRFCLEQSGFGRTAVTVRVADGARDGMPAGLRVSGHAD